MADDIGNKLEVMLREAKSEMDYQRHFGGFGYKQAKRRYERLLSQYSKRRINEGI